jgi:hypothetical protein
MAMPKTYFNDKFIAAVKTLVPGIRIIYHMAYNGFIAGYHITDGIMTLSVQFKPGNYAMWDNPVSMRDFINPLSLIDYSNTAHKAEIAVWSNTDGDMLKIAPHDSVIGYLDVQSVLFWLTDVFFDGFRVYRDNI